DEAIVANSLLENLLVVRHLAIVYQKRGTIAKSAVSKLHFIRLQTATPTSLSQQPPKETPPPCNLRRMRRDINYG
ncbi:MAG: hypothetical protein SOW92_07905, partial [Kiritimatiellia bacterium]|nr:hypothetical protein [Kiritimatiellia bacterium]